MRAPVSQIKNLSGNFEFHRGHFSPNVASMQPAEEPFMRPHHIREILFTGEQIEQRIRSLVADIADGGPAGHLVVIGILRGSFIFLADLVRGFARHGLHPRIDFILLSSYGSGTESNGTVRVLHDTSEDLAGADVLIVDDILDSGRTLAFARDLCLQRGARSVRTCVMLDKKGRRAVKMEADYAGFTVENVFVAGYGLDYDNRYRELPYIAKVTFNDP